MMSLYKRGQVWWMRFTYKGKQIRKSTETVDKKLAERIYHKLMGQIAEGKWFERLPGDEKTFREMMEKYMREHSKINKSPKSHIRDRSLENHLVQFFGEQTLTEICPKRISEYKLKRREQKAASATINKELTLMSHAFNLAMKEWEWVRENPVSRVSREKVNNHIERWLTFKEETRLLAASPKWLQEIVAFALNTGLRRGEILKLQWTQVDLFRKTLTLLEQKNRDCDTLPLNECALEILKARAKVRHIRNNNYVFYNGNGNEINARNLVRAFYSATEVAKLEGLRFHDLRHTWATRLVQSGVDLYTVQKLGRWKTISMVMRYAHHCSESLRPGAEALDRMRKQISTKLAQSGGQAERDVS
jgi:integrase